MAVKRLLFLCCSLGMRWKGEVVEWCQLASCGITSSVRRLRPALRTCSTRTRAIARATNRTSGPSPAATSALKSSSIVMLTRSVRFCATLQHSNNRFMAILQVSLHNPVPPVKNFWCRVLLPACPCWWQGHGYNTTFVLHALYYSRCTLLYAYAWCVLLLKKEVSLANRGLFNFSGTILSWGCFSQGAILTGNRWRKK